MKAAQEGHVRRGAPRVAFQVWFRSTECVRSCGATTTCSEVARASTGASNLTGLPSRSCEEQAALSEDVSASPLLRPTASVGGEQMESVARIRTMMRSRSDVGVRGVGDRLRSSDRWASLLIT